MLSMILCHSREILFKSAEARESAPNYEQRHFTDDASHRSRWDKFLNTAQKIDELRSESVPRMGSSEHEDPSSPLRLSPSQKSELKRGQQPQL
jgi:dsDNA-binding SOS-regulon protein